MKLTSISPKFHNKISCLFPLDRIVLFCTPNFVNAPFKVLRFVFGIVIFNKESFPSGSPINVVTSI